MSYKITSITKRGGRNISVVATFLEVELKVLSLWKQRLETTVYESGELIGKIWKEGRKWQWFLWAEKK